MTSKRATLGMRHRDAALESGDTSPQSIWRPYPKYMDSGVELLGKIPIAWNLTKLKRFVQFSGGGTPSKDNLEYWQGDIPWVSPKDMKSRIISDTIDKITEEAVAESATRVIGPGAVLIVVRSGILNHSIPVALSGTEVALNQDLKALIVDKSAVPEYLAYFIAGMQSMLLFAWRREGATVESLELELIANTVIPLPAIEQQRIIVGFLDRETAKIDALIEKKERLIELLQEKRTALITQGVTKGLDPTVPMKDSGIEWLGKIPAHWDVKPFKALLSRNDSGAWGEDFSEDGIIVLRSTEQTLDGKWNIENPAKRRLKPRESIETRLEEGDLVVTKSSGSELHIGKTSIVDKSVAALNCCFSNFMQRLRLARPNRSRIFWHFMNCPVAREQLIFLSSTTTGLGNLNGTILGNIQVPVATEDEQRKIASFLDRETAKIDTLVAKILEAIDRLKEYRTALISAAVTGKIDVRDTRSTP